ncbi:Mediator of RNA polymerase II transcription subunit 16 [Ancistrocladus abbreviatus]
MSPYDPDEGPSITGWRVQRWESCLKLVVLHQIFGNPTSSFGGQAPMQTVWETKVNKSIPPTNDFKAHQAVAGGPNADSSAEKAKRVTFDPFDMPSDVRTLARILYSAHGGEVAVAFLRGGVHIFSGPSFALVDNYQITVGSAIAAPAFSSTSCCSASVWHNSSKDCSILKIIRVLPPALASNQAKANSSTWERAIAERFWWSLLVGVDWWDAVGCTQSAAEDGIGEDMQWDTNKWKLIYGMYEALHLKPIADIDPLSWALLAVWYSMKWTYGGEGEHAAQGLLSTSTSSTDWFEDDPRHAILCDTDPRILSKPKLLCIHRWERPKETSHESQELCNQSLQEPFRNPSQTDLRNEKKPLLRQMGRALLTMA